MNKETPAALLIEQMPGANLAARLDSIESNLKKITDLQATPGPEYISRKEAAALVTNSMRAVIDELAPKTAAKPEAAPALATPRPEYSQYLKAAAVMALQKGADKIFLAALLKCDLCTLENWEKAANKIEFWRFPALLFNVRNCAGCKSGHALKGRKVAVCLINNGAKYEELAKLSGFSRTSLHNWVKDNPQCNAAGKNATAPDTAEAAALVTNSMRAVIDELATLAAELKETPAPAYMRAELAKVEKEAAALLSLVK